MNIEIIIEMNPSQSEMMENIPIIITSTPPHLKHISWVMPLHFFI